MLNLAGWLLFVVWAVAAGLPSLWFLGRSLRRQSDRVAEPIEWPFLSVVVPARDEGHKIEAGLRSLLAADYPAFEIIALDDRSRDDTGVIMDRLADEVNSNTDESVRGPELKVVHIRELPEGWLGKNHALHVGSQQARGEWILFTDGDVVYHPETLKRSLKYAVARNLDHLPLFPNIEAAGLFEAAFVACFALIFAAGTQPGLVPTRFPWFYLGVGAFNLVRRSALERAGGFDLIRLDILDDVKLGKLLKRTGSRSEVLRAGEGLNIRWQQSAWACITGLEKNAFASAGYSILHLLFVTSVTAAVFLGPLAGTLFAGGARLGFVAALVLSHLLFGVNSRLFGHSFWVFPLLIPAGMAFLFAFLRSTWITLRQGGVRWRDTFYPLDVLRKNVYR
ncbi:MAG: glycosyltransferase [Planctomycetes bacterium]|nr:glycosyltransferase [Planctomycetota bacterium]